MRCSTRYLLFSRFTVNKPHIVVTAAMGFGRSRPFPRHADNHTFVLSHIYRLADGAPLPREAVFLFLPERKGKV